MAVLALTVLLLVLGGCTRRPTEFEGHGRIRVTFHLGNLSDPRFELGKVEMIELTGRPEDRCGPGDCGFAFEGLSFEDYWRPGRWRVIPPVVEGWRRPDPIEIVVRPDELTTFEFRYENS